MITFRYGIGIEEQNSLVSRLTVYPNPTSGNFIVVFAAKAIEPVSVELLSFDGRVVWQSKVNTLTGLNSIRLENNRVPSGIYLVRLKTSHGDLGRKLIVK